MPKPEIDPRKENKAFAVWVILAVVVLAVSVFVAIGALKTLHSPVAPDANMQVTR